MPLRSPSCKPLLTAGVYSRAFFPGQFLPELKTFVQVVEFFSREKMNPISSRPLQTAQVDETSPRSYVVVFRGHYFPNPCVFIAQSPTVMVVANYHTPCSTQLSLSTHLPHTDIG